LEIYLSFYVDSPAQLCTEEEWADFSPTKKEEDLYKTLLKGSRFGFIHSETEITNYKSFLSYSTVM
jgi:hypothetical protein